MIGAPWYAYQGIAYGDPLGIQPHLRMNWAHIPPRTLALAIQQDGLTPLFTLWTGYAWGLVTTGGWVYAFNIALLALGLWGYGRAGRALWRDHKLEIVTLGVAWAGIFAAYLRWWTMFTFMNARHLLPGYLALLILVALGIEYGWSPRAARLMRLAFAALTVFVAWVIVGNVTLYEAFRTITFPPEQTPPLEGTRLQFGDAEFMGYRLDPPALKNGQPITATLCWRSLREDDALPVPYGFAFHLVADHNTIYAGRESFPGMGKYTLWQPGRAFCDRFEVQVKQAFVPARGYRVAVSLFEPQTTAPRPENNGNGPFVGWAASPGPALSAAERDSARFDFDGITLLDYALEATADGITLNLRWGTGDWQPRPVTLFVHVTDANGDLVGPPDAPLGGDVYPAFLWGANERTFDQSVAAPLSPGDYTVYVGLYDPQTAARLSAVDAQGQPAPDNRALLGTVRVE